MKRIRPVLSLAFICLLSIVITGCNIFKKDVKTETEVSKIKESMLNNLDNFEMDVTITSQTGFADVTIKMNCIQDNKNKLEYCKTSTLGIVDVEQYIDFNNSKSYSKTTTLFGGDENNNKWKTESFKGNINTNNSWLSLNDYLKNLEVSDYNGGKLYKGNISMKKIIKAINKSDSSSSIKIPSITDKDIPIEIFINKDGYIESTTLSFEVASIKEIINIKYKNFNNNVNLTLPNV